MCMKFSPRDLNSGHCPPIPYKHLYNYTCGVTIASRVRDDPVVLNIL